MQEPTPPELIVYCDGASRGNPGPAAYGIVVTMRDGREILSEGRAIGRCTNNEAEYRGLARALEVVGQYQPAQVEVRLDSELLVQQMNGRYRVRAPGLAPLHARVQELVRALPSVRFVHVPRGANARADALANAALDAQGGGRLHRSSMHHAHRGWRVGRRSQGP